MKHQIGDKVVIRTDLELDTLYSDMCIMEDMLNFQGKKVTITDIESEGKLKFYLIKEDRECWAWTDAMFMDHLTNADKIRAMSDMELAVFMKLIRSNSFNYICDSCNAIKKEDVAEELEWLRKTGE